MEHQTVQRQGSEVARAQRFADGPETTSSIVVVSGLGRRRPVVIGVDFADFELVERERLASKFPSARALIERLTPEPTRRETLLRS